MKILDSAAILAFITAFLYCVSTAYTYGYFGVLFLDSDLLERNFHQIMYHGLLQSFPILLTILFFCAISVTIHSAFTTGLINYVIKNENKEKFVSKLVQKLKPKNKHLTVLEQTHSKRVKKIWIVFSLFFIFTLLMAYIESKGVDSAKNMKNSIKEGKYRAVKLSVKQGDKPFALLYCGARNCAAIDPENKEIKYFPQKEHTHFFYDIKE
ncbi:hypothetical protein [Pseudoalteromonas sp. ASV78]|uniref:hypothetical protein n=1 Tax=Pseudoalteromonas sp. ASV78 TaxID=3397851 RepID=UPI0039FBBC53